MTVTNNRWRGVDRRGTGRAGGFLWDIADMTAIVADRFKTGWRSLVVEADGREVARIACNEGKRTWWAESATPVPKEG